MGIQHAFSRFVCIVAVVLLVAVSFGEAGKSAKKPSFRRGLPRGQVVQEAMAWFDVLDSAKMEHLQQFFKEREQSTLCQGMFAGLFDCTRSMMRNKNLEVAEEEQLPCNKHSDCPESHLCCLSSASVSGWTSCMRPDLCGLSRGELDRGIVMMQHMHFIGDLSKKFAGLKSDLQELVRKDFPVLAVSDLLKGNMREYENGKEALLKKVEDLEKRHKGLLLAVLKNIESYKEGLNDKRKYEEKERRRNDSDGLWTVYGKNYDSSEIVASYPHDQGACGNCFAFAVATAMSQRLYHKTNDNGESFFSHPFNTFLSPQQIAEKYISKRKTSSGGNVMLALRVISGSTLLPDFCHPYNCVAGTTIFAPDDMIPSECSVLSLPGPPDFNPYETYTGTFGDAIRMGNRVMTTLESSGALVLGLKYWSSTDFSDFYDTDGDVFIPTRFQPGNTNHAVVLVGWGEQESTTHPGKIIKYWLLQNSHGDTHDTSHWVKFYRGPIDCVSYGSQCALDLILAVGSTPIGDEILGGKRGNNLLANIAAPILPTVALQGLSELSTACEHLECMNGGLIARDSGGGCSCVCDNGFHGPQCESKSVMIYTGENCNGFVAVTLRRAATVKVSLMRANEPQNVVDSFTVNPTQSLFRKGNTFFTPADPEKVASLIPKNEENAERAVALMEWETSAGVYEMTWPIGFLHGNEACDDLYSH